ncbi:MAG: endolytic transglycosylase MltG [Cytophagales bacterium]|nr:endolytic transglycosylase MltG [Cytophagales bacterium]
MFKSRTLLAGILVFFSVLLATFSFYFYQIAQSPNLQVDKEDTYLLIPTGAGYSTVMDSLKYKKILHDELSFRFLSKLLKYQEAVKPGRYKIRKNMNNREAILMLRAGRQTPVRLTFNNIRLKEELPGRLSRNLEADSTKLRALLTDPAVVAKYGFDTTTITCMFLPNTYELYWNTSSDELLDRMHKEYEKFWTDKRKEQAKAIGFTPVQVSILASIVEAEQGRWADERPRLAGVYINRMTSEETDFKLQADPTLVFAHKDFSMRRVLNVHKQFDSPYNTYKYRGLPPGPINLPSPASIDAVLNYEKNDYLYFCAKADFSGYHAFAETYDEHLKNARLYQAALNAKKIMK